MGGMDASELKALIRDIPDFPEPGIVFKDITPLLADPIALASAIDDMSTPYSDDGVTKVAGIEARGFIFGVPIARLLGVGFIPVRKPGKLPHAVEQEIYELEYGTDLLEIHKDAISEGDRVLIVDDVLATGGTAAAAIRLVERLGGEVAGLSVLVELGFLKGADKLPEGTPLTKLVRYDNP
jgi:adenine phosphoribosyltransferase